MAKSIRWGILGPGDIARVFAKGLSFLPDAELVAVGSRSMERAKKFAEEFEVPHPHGSYGELVRDPDVDVIYVCTPHPFHKENSLLALNAGKAVLCEKPFTINAKEAEEVISVARKKKLFVMEAMWTRFLPVMEKVREWLSEGVIGEVRMLSAQVGFRSGWNPEARSEAGAWWRCPAGYGMLQSELRINGYGRAAGNGLQHGSHRGDGCG